MHNSVPLVCAKYCMQRSVLLLCAPECASHCAPLCAAECEDPSVQRLEYSKLAMDEALERVGTRDSAGL